MSLDLKKSTAVLFLAVASLTACSKAPIATETTDNPNITYDVLFNRHGCEVGRIQDNGRSVYAAFCPSQTLR